MHRCSSHAEEGDRPSPTTADLSSRASRRLTVCECKAGQCVCHHDKREPERVALQASC